MRSNRIRILLFDESPQRAAALVEALNHCGYHDVHWQEQVGSVFDSVTTIDPDVILIDVESPRRDTLEQLTLVREQRPRPVVMFTQDHHVQTIQAAIDSGVSAYMTNEIDAEHVRPAIQIAMSTFRQFQKLTEELAQVRHDLSNQKTVERAKRVLMKQNNLSEEQAYHVMRRFAMNRKQKIADVAQRILELSELKLS
jgi:response regulator NasT